MTSLARLVFAISRRGKPDQAGESSAGTKRGVKVSWQVAE